MSISWPTLITLAVSSVLVPWLTSHGVTLSPEATAWISTAIVAALTAATHVIHTQTSKPLPPPSPSVTVKP